MNTNNNEDQKEVHYNIKHCDRDTILQLYGITISSDGIVTDETTKETHSSVDEWINSSYIVDYEDFEKFSKYDDHFT